MKTIGEEGGAALDAVADFVDLLRLAHGAIHRLGQNVHSKSFGSVDAVCQKLHDLRQDTKRLNDEVNKYVREIENEL